MLKLGFVFPGQGAQYVGMAKELSDRYPIAKQTFDEADEALGFKLSELCFSGPEESLRLTYHTQPALLTASIATYRVFQQFSSIVPAVVAGHSLGEYTALVASGSLQFADAVQLVHKRGRYMDEAVPAGQGAMAAVLGMGAEELSAVCQQAWLGDDVVELANVNCPGQIVISGTSLGVERASQLAKEHGAKRVIPLVVSGPFHCSLMRKAAGRLSQALAEVTLLDSAIPVVANVDALPRQTTAELRAALEAQLYSPVLWETSVGEMLTMGVEGFVEFGPGTVLSGLIKKVERRILTLHVENEASLQETLAAIVQ
ncbi:MAG: [acyl-carrier-protein] S-malonyltransferase [Alicyclobacillus sp. RIFOXYA1_FULL_53_8]|nr:MAG: [acyl-carrier-protein] S-malonyltransferase [Alicyclobacillus sp. RIFOXYA1_FULL_53_8]